MPYHDKKMKIRSIIEKLGYEVIVEGRDQDVNTGYTSDLLSDVMGNCPEGSLWITIQRHMNVIAVAQLKKIPVIILVNGIKPDNAVKERAKEEGIFILSTSDSSFIASGKIYHFFNESTDQ